MKGNTMNEHELRRKYYTMLTQLSHGTTATGKRLAMLPRYSEQDIKEAKTIGLIEKNGETNTGESLYKITDFGRRIMND